jgi:hypothetical protein
MTAPRGSGPHRCVCGKRAISVGYLNHHIRACVVGTHAPVDPEAVRAAELVEQTARLARNAKRIAAKRAAWKIKAGAQHAHPASGPKAATTAPTLMVVPDPPTSGPYLCACTRRFATHRLYLDHIRPYKRALAVRYHALEEHPADRMIGTRVPLARGVYPNELAV